MMGRFKGFALVLVSVTFLFGCTNVQEPQDDEELAIVQEKNAALLSDGTPVDLWRSDIETADIYKLSDGTELLVVYDPSGPENISITGQDSFDDLNETAKRRIRLHYDEQGLLYNVQNELENAYQEYKSCQNDHQTYFARIVGQSITPTASNERIMGFVTTVQLPLGGQLVQELHRNAIFDRETGSQVDLWSMFTVPQETVMEHLLDAGDITDPSLYAEMAAAIRPERIMLCPDYVLLEFPAEELDHSDTDYQITVNYSELSDIMQSWAIPNASQ